MRQTLIRGPSQREKEEWSKSSEDFCTFLKNADRRTFAEDYKNFLKQNPNVEKHLRYHYYSGVNEALKRKYAGNPFEITLDLHTLQRLYRSNGAPIPVDGRVGTESVKCLLAHNDWYKLKPTGSEMMQGKIKLLDHLTELIPLHSRTVDFCTFQNGINNSSIDFSMMGESILKKMPDKPLCIGIYNPTKGLLHDAEGVLSKLSGHLSDSICITMQCFLTIIEKISKISKNLGWIHIAHSEGGIIAETILTLLESQNKLDKFRNHLLVSTYGSVLPIPKIYAKAAINTYSRKDGATLPRVQEYLASLGERVMDYEIEIIPESPNNLYLLVGLGLGGLAARWTYERALGDHGFQNPAYQSALETNIIKLRKT